MKAKKLLLFMALPLFLLSACDDDENTNTEGKQIPVGMVEREGNSADSSTVAWTYDSSNRLTKCTYKSAGGYLNEDLYTYSGSDLVKIEEKEGTWLEKTHTFTKTDTVITVMERDYNESGVQTDSTKRTITLNADGLPSKIRYNDSGFTGSYSVYSYDSKKNISKIEEYRDNKLNETTTYEYDNKIGTASQTGTPRWAAIYLDDDGDSDDIFNSINNRIKMTRVDKDDASQSPNFWTYVYTYDQNNYPLTTIKSKGNNHDNPVLYKFTYKKL